MAATGASADSRVIGYFALDGDRLLIENGACVVTGSEAQMQAMVQRLPPHRRQTIAGDALDFRARKIRFGAIVEGMSGGGAYAFDRESYEQFRPLANSHGFDLAEFDAALPGSEEGAPSGQIDESKQEPPAQGVTLVTVRLDR